MTRAKVSHSPTTCMNCRFEFIPSRKDKIFCSRACKEANAGKQQKIKTAENKEKRQLIKDLKFENSSFGEYIYRECTRAGTVEILQGHNLDTLLGLYDIYKSKIKYSGLIEGKCGTDFHISHIYPVKNKDFIGLLHPKNLVISGASYNTSRKNKTPDIESEWKIQISSLDKAYLVKRGTTKEQVFKLLRNLLGLDLYRFFIDAAKPQNSMKVRLIRKLIKHGYDSKFLVDLEIAELQELVFEITNKPLPTPTLNSASLALVLKSELERTNKTNSVLYDLIAHLTQKGHRHDNAVIGIDSDLEEFVYRAAQDFLHDTNYDLNFGGNHILSYLSIDSKVSSDMYSTKLEHMLSERTSKA